MERQWRVNVLFWNILRSRRMVFIDMCAHKKGKVGRQNMGLLTRESGLVFYCEISL